MTIKAVQDAVKATVVAVALPIRNQGRFVGHVGHIDITIVGKFRRLYTKNNHTRTFQFSINEFIKNIKWKIEMFKPHKPISTENKK